MPIALVLEKERELALRDMELDLTVGDHDVRIAMDVVGICGSDVHYYRHGKIGPFVVREPMILGHEGAGTVVACGGAVRHLAVGDRVCIEPGIPDFSSRPSRIGLYNLDPSLTFWATPPVHGCLTPEVVHPASLTYKLPDNVSAAEGAMVEPLAVGLQAVHKTGVAAGDVALVLGAGPIGILVALSALSAGCARVLIFDPASKKLDIAPQYAGIQPLHATGGPLAEQVLNVTDGWGVDLVYECSGASAAFNGVADCIRPGGTLACIGMPTEPIPIDIVALQVKEIRIVTVFRYANVYDRAIALMSEGKIDVKPLISATYTFCDSIEAFERADTARPEDVKIQIAMR
ncbi:NAD(P)-dependent alcohol dehydrogenase [Rhizobium sp. GN54]|uniref:NAD(P)-dependent alcohol dehydrogenase n=1 Tax=Rhizobium sp. GN54 TaxID=2898150 RepID=UPI001E620158|nr:NAD(P)-dependent alcohol dehydrogenase [Rhizobium sp. GN54]MCD2185345.1 NAD(P)-dependent alcohol dehydrogenase [Rhizobium sp. GN54]